MNGPLGAWPVEYHLVWPEGEVVLSKSALIEQTIVELDQRYLREGRSVFVGIDSRTASLDVGLGVMHAAVWTEGEDDDLLISRGCSDSTETVAFEFDGHETQLPASSTIERADALAAVAAFIETGARPAGLDWQVAPE